jgi:hypothetical protein
MAKEIIASNQLALMAQSKVGQMAVLVLTKMAITATVVESAVSMDLSCQDSKVCQGNRVCLANRDYNFQVDQVSVRIARIQLEHMHQ